MVALWLACICTGNPPDTFVLCERAAGIVQARHIKLHSTRPLALKLCSNDVAGLSEAFQIKDCVVFFEGLPSRTFPSCRSYPGDLVADRHQPQRVHTGGTRLHHPMLFAHLVAGKLHLGADWWPNLGSCLVGYNGSTLARSASAHQGTAHKGKFLDSKIKGTTDQGHKTLGKVTNGGKLRLRCILRCVRSNYSRRLLQPGEHQHGHV